jgi:hypothetical protein
MTDFNKVKKQSDKRRVEAVKRPVLADMKIRTAADLQHQTFEPLKWIVPNFLPEGATLLFGKPKAGKSWLSLDIALAVADGGEALGQRCEQGDVLGLFLEDSDRRIQSRITKMFGANKARWPARLQYVTKWPRSSDGGLDLIRDWIRREKKPRLVIIDILQKFRDLNAPRSESAYQSDYNGLAAIQALASETRVSVIVVHHMRKAGGEDVMDLVSGTLGLNGAVDTLIALGRDQAGHVLHAEGRDLAGYTMAVSQGANMRWSADGPRPAEITSAERGHIVRVLTRADKAISVRDIATAIEADPKNVKNLLKKMKDDGIIVSTARGMYQMAPDARPGTQLGMAI